MTQVTFTCEQCGKATTRRYRASATNQFCSQRCRGHAFLGVAHTAKQIAARTMPGERNPRWRGDAAAERSGRTRALRAFPMIGPCTRCGAKKAERHHVDGNTLNNAASNVEALCRRCHMTVDGRLEEASARLRSVQPDGVAARHGQPRRAS